MLVNIHVGKVKLDDETEVEGIKPKSGTALSAGVDVSTPYPFVLKKGEKHLVNTGLIIKAPRGFCIQVLPRSGLACKHGITIPNSPGLIDRDYCGPEDFVKVMLVNNGDKDFNFAAGDRVAQLLFTPYISPDFSFHSDPNFNGPTSRGGFGSTGLGE